MSTIEHAGQSLLPMEIPQESGLLDKRAEILGEIVAPQDGEILSALITKEFSEDLEGSRLIEDYYDAEQLSRLGYQMHAKFDLTSNSLRNREPAPTDDSAEARNFRALRPFVGPQLKNQLPSGNIDRNTSLRIGLAFTISAHIAKLVNASLINDENEALVSFGLKKPRIDKEEQRNFVSAYNSDPKRSSERLLGFVSSLRASNGPKKGMQYQLAAKTLAKYFAKSQDTR